MTVHNEAKVGEIAKTVLMPGDPMRAKYIAEHFLEDYKLVNKVRGMYAYTGKYKGHSHLDEYIKSSNLNQNYRNVFEAINDFEKHIALLYFQW